ncbi:recombinase family protein [Agrobacterium rosae]|uniref:recombinase family protein n=1 Tax=Agrobacterium rosae TaxID=1972867 RepID=UPI0019D3C140|nr:recombinase family protein [Agrobacterium rosae]MBN7809077.1 recombinase family protein [Agrobacterium rosae]
MQQPAQNRMAYSYIRMSTEKQIKGDSMRRQLEWSQTYAARHGLDLQDVTSFADIGVSAWKGLNRSKGRLGAFIELAREGTIPSSSYLLIENLDRLSRTTPLEALDLFKEILQLGITVVARGEFGDEETYTWNSLNSNSNQLISTLTSMLRANRESERKSQLIRSSMKNRRVDARLGKKTNQTPPSWITATKITKGEYEYHLNDRADVVRWIFERSAEGVGFDRIARELNAKGEPTLKPSKRGWWHANIQAIVTSRSAIGEYQPGEMIDGKYVSEGDPILDYYPAVIGHDLWLRAQKIVHRNRKGGRAGTQFSNLLDGLAECVHCRSRMYMIGNSRSDKQWKYLVCSTNFRNIMRTNEVTGETVPVCPIGRSRFRYDILERSILENVTEFGGDDLLKQGKVTAEIAEIDEELAKLSISLIDLRKREARLTEVIETEDGAQIAGLLKALRERTVEREDAEKRQETLRHDREVMAAKHAALDPASAIEAMRQAWEAADDETRYALRVRTNASMKGMIDHVEFDSEGNHYTVIIEQGRRAYRFANPKFVRKDIKIIPQVANFVQHAIDVPLGVYTSNQQSPEMSAVSESIERLKSLPVKASLTAEKE